MERFRNAICFNPLAGILPEPPTKRFASLSESQLDKLVGERHPKNTRFTKCSGYVIKQMINGSACTIDL